MEDGRVLNYLQYALYIIFKGWLKAREHVDGHTFASGMSANET